MMVVTEPYCTHAEELFKDASKFLQPGVSQLLMSDETDFNSVLTCWPHGWEVIRDSAVTSWRLHTHRQHYQLVVATPV